ncbi:MAG: peptidoglycan DD-metalloendopeptidase family protein [Dehalococcoidia bacterium]|nr:peptidoglycan DD-metalloendopeptidase family protein [Dehalococcoidia bacterium]
MARIPPGALIALLFALLIACSGDETPPQTLIPTVQIEAAATAVATQALPAQPLPSPTIAATSPPATATATPAGSLQFRPGQLAQGGMAVVYLNEAASSATVRFQERQYPMLHDGARWWAIIGVGALVQPGLHPISVIYTPSGRDTSTSIVQSIAVTDRDFPVEQITLDPQTAALLAPDIVQAELAQRAAIYSGFTAQRLWSGAFVAPGRGVLSGHFGEGRSYNGGPVTDYHRGTDFIGDIGAPVVAAARGRVVFTGELRVRGNAIMLDHGAGVFSAYHHLSSIDVTEGQLVNAGDRIGAVGSTGLVTGPHLHWEVIVRGIEVDGELWLAGQEIGP